MSLNMDILLLLRLITTMMILLFNHGGSFLVVVDAWSVSSTSRLMITSSSSSSSSLLTSSSVLFSSSASSSSSSSVWDSYSTIGQEISTLSTDATITATKTTTTTTRRMIWDIASRFWIPTDENLPPHWKSQSIHHEKRQRWASQFLLKLSTLLVTSRTPILPSLRRRQQQPQRRRLLGTISTVYDDFNDGDDDDDDDIMMNLPALSRVLQAAAMGGTIGTTTTTTTTTTSTMMVVPSDRVEKEGIWILDSLTGIHALVGRWGHILFQKKNTNKTKKKDDYYNDDDEDEENDDTEDEDRRQTLNVIVMAIQMLIDRVSVLDYPQLDQACRAYWAIQGIVARVEALTIPPIIIFEERVKALPFEIIPCGVDWSQLQQQQQQSYSEMNRDIGHEDDVDDDESYNDYHHHHHREMEDICQRLIQTIPFQKDIIVTRMGNEVQERRGTAWIAKEGIGALAYSGKLMPPQPIPAVVDDMMRTVELRLDLPTNFFDCALCNHYADSTAACKFHTDPEHGTMWDRMTVVVAAGSDRIFAFKPIETTWKDWDIIYRFDRTTTGGRGQGGGGGGDKTAASIHLFSGDLVVMRDTCNDDFYHAVYTGISDDPRVSLVLKRAVGRGHGLAGQGKRRRSQHQQQQPQPQRKESTLSTRKTAHRDTSLSDRDRRKGKSGTSRR